MKTGSYFTIGTLHKVCEDYAVAGPDYVILSDGCSNAGGPRLHTDWGSRILCKAAEQWLDRLRLGEVDGFFSSVLTTALIQQRMFPGLPSGCLSATLVVALKMGDAINTYIMGDGVVAARRRSDGVWVALSYEFPSGAPFYLRYETSNMEESHYLDAFGGKVSTRKYEIDFEKRQVIVDNLNPTDIRDYESRCFENNWRLSEYDTVVVFTDGVHHFHRIVKTETSRHTENIATEHVLQALLGYSTDEPPDFEAHCDWMFRRNVEGSFVRENWHNQDDVAVGGIYCGKAD